MFGSSFYEFFFNKNISSVTYRSFDRYYNAMNANLSNFDGQRRRKQAHLIGDNKYILVYHATIFTRELSGKLQCI